MHSVDSPTAFNVAGLYQLTGYHTSTLSDDNPTGTLNATQIDNQHLNLVVKGTSGKIKINYSYLNVVVISTGQVNLGQDTFTLLYKGHPIGVAGNDAISRYLTLTPSSTVRLDFLDI